MAAFFYSTNYANDISAFFFLSVMGLIISDLILFAIYILNFQEFRYIDNLFYIFGLYFLLRAYKKHIAHQESLQEKKVDTADKAKADDKDDNPKVYK